MFLPLEHKIHIFSPPCNVLYLLIASQLVDQLTHIELIPFISEEFLSKLLSVNMMTLSTGIIYAANGVEITYELSNTSNGNKLS